MRKINMKKAKKKLLILFSSCAFVALMMVNVSVSMDGIDSISNICLSGVIATTTAYGEDPTGFCYADTPCPSGSSTSAVACYGAEYCTSSPLQYAECDGIVNWC